MENWIILGPLGAGGQGIVWSAVRKSDDAAGALKVFRPDRSGGHESAARMETEAAALRQLEHPGIVRVLDSGAMEDGQFYIATELVEGCDLHRLLHVEKLTPERALSIGECVAAALEHAHGRGIIHRDLKPANVLTGRGGVVKLVDFSLARRTSVEAPQVSVTRDGTTFGTPYYLAPEVMRGTPATTSSDLYALGVMLYEMLTGAPPAGRFARVSEKCGLPREADALIESLLSEEPSQRPASAAVVLRKLQGVQNRLAGSAAARVRRQRWLVAGGIAGVAALAGGIGYFAPRPVPPPPGIATLNAKGFPNPAAATRAEPFVNSLGMSFIPVPQVPVLFCRHETRMGEYFSYLDGVRDEQQQWAATYGSPLGTRSPLHTLTPIGWTVTPPTMDDRQSFFGVPFQKDGPACGINLLQSRRFCAWLTWREQREGRLSPGDYYRLPTDTEWSAAAGLPAEAGATPEDRHRKLPAGEPVYPWGSDWPPPPGYGNYAGTEARDATWPVIWLNLKTANDSHVRTAPSGSFAENAAGLHDMWGNVWEWCDTPRNAVSNTFTLRGASWVEGGYPVHFRRDYRRFEVAARRETTIGFRCVLVVGK